jgi:hypothetical protein
MSVLAHGGDPLSQHGTGKTQLNQCKDTLSSNTEDFLTPSAALHGRPSLGGSSHDGHCDTGVSTKSQSAIFKAVIGPSHLTLKWEWYLPHNVV